MKPRREDSNTDTTDATDESSDDEVVQLRHRHDPPTAEAVIDPNVGTPTVPCFYAASVANHDQTSPW